MNKKDLFFKILKNGGLFLILMVATFYFVFRDLNIATVVKTISHINWVYLSIAILCMFVFICCEAINFRRNLTVLGYKTSLANCINYSMNGFFFSSITPSASGGQPAQIYQMYKDDIKVSHSTLVLFIELIFFQLVTIIYGLFGFFSQNVFLSKDFASVKYLFFIGVTFNFLMLLFLVLVIFYSPIIRNIANVLIKVLRFFKYKKVDSLDEKVDTFISDYKEYGTYILKNKPVIFKTFMTKCVQLFAFHSVPYWIYRSFGLNEYSILLFVGLQGILFVSVSALPLPGAIGASESGFLILFKLLFPISILNESMLLSRGVSFYLFVFISGVFLLTRWIMTSKAKEKEKQKVVKHNRAANRMTIKIDV